MLRPAGLCLCLCLISASLFAQSTFTSTDSSTTFPEMLTETVDGNTLDAEQLGLFSKRSLEARINFLPGTIFRDGRLHLFGGTSLEAGYFINGVNVTHRLRGRSAIHIIPEALQSVSVSTLPGDASFDGVTSGLLNTHLREGGERWRSSLHYRSDAFSSQDKTLLGSYGFGEQNTVLTLGGPLGKYLRFFGAAEYQQLNDPSKQVFEGATFNGLLDTFDPQMPEFIDVRLPEGSRENYDDTFLALNSNLTLRANALRGSFQFGLTSRQTSINTMPILTVFNDREMYENLDSWYAAAQVGFVPSPASDLTIRYSRVSSSFARHDELFEDEYLAWYDSSRNDAAGNSFRGAINPQLPRRIRAINFQGSGSPLSETFVKSQHTRQNLQLEGSYDFFKGKDAALIGRAGVDYQRESSRFFTINGRSVLRLLLQLPEGSSPEDIQPETLLLQADFNAIGYDRLGNKQDIEGPSSARSPMIFATFGEVRFSNERITASAGFRYAIFDTDTYLRTNNSTSTFDPETGLLDERAFSKNDSRGELLPRFNLTVRPFRSLRIYAGLGRFMQHTNSYFGNSFASYQRNQQLSIGATVADNVFGIFNIGFTNNGLTWITERFDPPESKISNRHLILHYATPELGHVNLSANYTYQTGDIRRVFHRRFYNPLIEYESFGPSFDTRFTSTSFFNSKHDVNMILSYQSRSKSEWLNGFRVALHPEITSGVSYVPTFSNQIPEYFFAGLDDLGRVFATNIPDFDEFRTPLTWQLNASLSKAVRFSCNRSVTIGLDIINIFDRQNAINVYPLTGEANRIGIESNRGFIELANAIEGGEPEFFNALNVMNGESFRAATGKELYDTPRQILVRVGIGL